MYVLVVLFLFFKQKPAYELRISYWSSDVCSSDLALLVFEQRLEQMFRRNLLMVHADRDGLRRLQEALGAIGEFLEVHAVPFIVHRSDSVALMQHKPIRPISSCRIYSGIQPSTSVTA